MSNEQQQPMPSWIAYNPISDVLTIHGKRYSAAMFGEDGFLAPPGTVLRVEQGQPDCVTVTTVRDTAPQPQPWVGLTDEQIDRHTITAGECPSQSKVILVSSIKRLREKNAAPQPQPKQEPFGYFKAEPFGWTDCAETDAGAKALYEAPQPQQWVSLTDEQSKALSDARNEAMTWAVKGRIPECGAFAGIAQNLDWLCDQFAIGATLREKNGGVL
jgi:hypothetical protein